LSPQRIGPRRSSPGLAARFDPSSGFDPLDGFIPTRHSRVVVPLRTAHEVHTSKLSLRPGRWWFPTPCPLAVPRPTYHRRTRQLQGLVLGSEFLETVVRSQHASLWFPFRVLTFAALAHGLVPGHPPARFRPCDQAKPGALESCVAAEAARRLRRTHPFGFLDLSVTRGFPHVQTRLSKNEGEGDAAYAPCPRLCFGIRRWT
jgi:hypothetical protein